MKRCLAIRHLPFEDLGFFDRVLQDEGFAVEYLDAPQAERRDIEEADPDLLIVLGGPLSANDEKDYPFIGHELRMLERRLSNRRATLGICLGGQLMARALGGVVSAGTRSEIGWLPMQLSDAGRHSTLRHFESRPVFHWHSDVFSLPPAATSLASTADCEHQAFSLGANILGLQFHPEVTAQGLETWYVGHYRALQGEDTPDVQALREISQRDAPGLALQGERFLQEWLGGIER